MSNLSPHLKEIGKTLAPEYGPESPNEAVERLFRYYRRAGDQGKHAFVAALIAECVALKAILRSRKDDIDARFARQQIVRHTVYIDRQGEERSVRADLAQDFTDRKGLRECRECSELCLPVLYEDYENGHTEHTCYLCDFEWMVRDGTQVDPTGKSGAELAAEYARRQDSYYRAVSPVSAVRKVWS